MSSKAIEFRNISKSYRIGSAVRRHDTFGAAAMGMLTSPFRRGRNRAPEGEGDGEFWALRDVTFDVDHGEILGIIGRNGAGKSTLLKVLSRITEPTSGSATVRGRVGSLLEVGTGFHPELTGRDNIFLNGSILGMDRAYISRRFDEIVSFAEVERFIDTPVKRYSSGMYLRLAFAVAAHLEPEILVIDEVLAVGDAAFQQKCLGRMGEVAHEGRTVLFVSHHMAVLREISSRVLWMENGRVRDSGPPGPMVDSYLAAGMPVGKRVFENERCAILAAEAVDSEGAPAPALEAGKAWSVRVQYELREALVTGASIRISNAQGTIICDLHEFIGGADVRGAGSYETTFDLSAVSLAPGNYYLTVWLMVHYGPMHLTADPYGHFTVMGSLAGYGGTTRPYDVGGVLYVEPQVTTRRVRPAPADYPAREIAGGDQSVVAATPRS